ncbi:MAG: peptide chain release factor N(5)-glutamine methyltransferase [Anaerolineales bacterium]|nr:peptide chain release factor N(5)-glutamine methyltransferase [Anaerolineales bacterium]
MENLLKKMAGRLAIISDTPNLDAQVLLAHVLGKPRAWVLAHPEVELTPAQQAALEEALARLERGEPLPYVLGRWEFFGLEFILKPGVLIPRPETELLVETALHWLRAHPERRRVADIGTGSGCIAIALAANLPELRVVATDISPEAIDVAKRNAKKFCMSNRIEFLCCDLFPTAETFDFRFSTLRQGFDRLNLPVQGRLFDLIVANLPYIPTKTLRGLRVYGREPTLALDGGADGLDIIRRLLDLAPHYLTPGGMLLLEIEASQGVKALSLAYDTFAEAEISLHQDLAGRDRLIEIAPKDDG